MQKTTTTKAAAPKAKPAAKPAAKKAAKKGGKKGGKKVRHLGASRANLQGGCARRHAPAACAACPSLRCCPRPTLPAPPPSTRELQTAAAPAAAAAPTPGGAAGGLIGGVLGAVSGALGALKRRLSVAV